jgi:hypothetical protein
MMDNPLQGTIYDFQGRRFLSVVLPFETAIGILKWTPYSAKTGKGEQREIVQSHARELKRAMARGEYTPVPLHAGLRPEHRAWLREEGGAGTVTVPEKQRLPLVDGGHRLYAMDMLRDDAREAVENATTDPERRAARAEVDRINALPVPLTLLLDGDLRDDFVNLQKGKPVDRSHLLSLTVQKQDVDKDLALAYQVGNVLGRDGASPFKNVIRFDTTQKGALPISCLLAKGASDRSSSLRGLARVGLQLVGEAVQPEELAYFVTATYDALNERAPDLLESDMLLAEPVHGKRGPATVLVGLATALAYRVLASGRRKVNKKDLGRLVDAARAQFDQPLYRYFNANMKRELLGAFVKEFFEDRDVEKHDDVPLGLLGVIVPSAYGLDPLPKAGRKQAATVDDDEGAPLREAAVDGVAPTVEEDPPDDQEVQDRPTPVDEPVSTEKGHPLRELVARIVKENPIATGDRRKDAMMREVLGSPDTIGMRDPAKMSKDDRNVERAQLDIVMHLGRKTLTPGEKDLLVARQVLLREAPAEAVA